jgi:trk system potassium uptake protein TrkH
VRGTVSDMNYKMMGRLLGHILMVEAAFMLPSLFIGLYKGEKSSVVGFAVSIGIIFLVGLILINVCSGSQKGFKVSSVFYIRADTFVSGCTF